MKVALVHDYLNQYGGAERVLEELHDIWPNATVYCSIYDPKKMPASFKTWDIRPSWLNKIPFAGLKHQALLPILPQAFETMDLSDYSLVISSSSGFAHGVHTGIGTCHVCYCHSPARFLWDYENYVKRESLSWTVKALVSGRLGSFRAWDRVTAERADAWISTSRVVQGRVRKFYGKRSVIIPPPVKVARFQPAAAGVPGEHYLLLMRLVGWKRGDIAIDACTRLGLPLIVAGDGREEADLRQRAGSSVRFVGRVNDEQMRELYANCKALILPSEEDFGITPLEAMASGRPVIAYGQGGALDTIVPGITGVFFHQQNVESLMSVLKTFNEKEFDPKIIREHAEKYDSSVFASKIIQHVEQAMRVHGRRYLADPAAF